MQPGLFTSCRLTPTLRPLSVSPRAKLTLQFGTQEPGTSDEILQFCQANYGVTFPIARKADVNGPEAQPIWAYLKEHAENGPVEKIDWNFSKFVICECIFNTV